MQQAYHRKLNNRTSPKETKFLRDISTTGTLDPRVPADGFTVIVWKQAKHDKFL